MTRKVSIGNISLSEEEIEAVTQVCRRGRLTEHANTVEFEKRWAETIGTKYAIALSSGTGALISGLYTLKHLSGDERRKKVITTPLTFIATSNAIRIANLEPVYADVKLEDFTIQPSEIERILETSDPSEFLAILPVHLMGYTCEMDRICRIAKEHGLFVFEDAAQAHGSRYLGKTVGSFGDLSDFSFYIAHNIQAGELGAVNTDNPLIRDLVKKIKAHGRMCSCGVCKRAQGSCPYQGKDFDPRFTHDVVGFNFKSNEFSTAIALKRIKTIGEINSRRRANVQYLNGGLKRFERVLQLPLHSEDVSYLGYPLVLKDGGREKLTAQLEERGIETRPLFGCIPLQQPAYGYLKEQYSGKLPNAEYLGRQGFYIGCHQDVTQLDLDYIIKSFGEILDG